MKPEELKVGQKYKTPKGSIWYYIGPCKNGRQFIFEGEDAGVRPLGLSFVEELVGVRDPRRMWAVYLRGGFYMATDDIESAQIQANYYSGTIAEFKEVI